MSSQLVFSHRVLRPRDVAAVTTLVGESGVRELVAAEVKGGEGGLEAGIIKLHVNMKNINSKS